MATLYTVMTAATCASSSVHKRAACARQAHRQACRGAGPPSLCVPQDKGMRRAGRRGACRGPPPQSSSFPGRLPGPQVTDTGVLSSAISLHASVLRSPSHLNLAEMEGHTAYDPHRWQLSLDGDGEAEAVAGLPHRQASGPPGAWKRSQSALFSAGELLPAVCFLEKQK